jgi:hypothetical protein
VVVRILRQIRVADVELGLYTTEYGSDVLEAIVFRTSFFAEVHEERAICTAVRRVFVPGTGVVEAQPDGTAGIIVALTVGVFEEFREFSGNVVPFVLVNIYTMERGGKEGICTFAAGVQTEERFRGHYVINAGYASIEDVLYEFCDARKDACEKAIDETRVTCLKRSWSCQGKER